jgi:hypothetical protein
VSPVDHCIPHSPHLHTAVEKVLGSADRQPDEEAERVVEARILAPGKDLGMDLASRLDIDAAEVREKARESKDRAELDMGLVMGHGSTHHVPLARGKVLGNGSSALMVQAMGHEHRGLRASVRAMALGDGRNASEELGMLRGSMIVDERAQVTPLAALAWREPAKQPEELASTEPATVLETD